MVLYVVSVYAGIIKITYLSEVAGEISDEYSDIIVQFPERLCRSGTKSEPYRLSGHLSGSKISYGTKDYEADDS